MADATKALIDGTVDFVDRARPKPGKPWQIWLDAELGFRDYWYPAALSHQIEEGSASSVKLLGEDIMLPRQEGRVFAVEDRCCIAACVFRLDRCFIRKTR